MPTLNLNAILALNNGGMNIWRKESHAYDTWITVCAFSLGFFDLPPPAPYCRDEDANELC